MNDALVVVGAGGFGRETLDVIDAVNRTSGSHHYELLGVVDDHPSVMDLKRLQVRGVRLLGSVDEWLSTGGYARFVIAVGSPNSRRALAYKFDADGREPATIVHPNSVVGSAGSLGPGTVICAGVQVSTNVHLGQHVHVNPAAVLGHDCVIGDFSSVNPGAILSGGCVVGCGALVGAGSVVLAGVTVGDGAIVGAAACVVHDVRAATTVKGVPAR